ncbi:MAG: glutamate 5-kinase [Deltaproteobacteria bacterium]|nr:glutamate 5-kinase [Deltaproteobacteria bacterium]
MTEDAQESPGEVRRTLAQVTRVVLKVGSRSLLEEGRFEELAAAIAGQRAAGRQVVLVSSGAIALGVDRLGLSGRPRQLPELQAAAAAGQAALMRRYEEAFDPHSVAPAQILLTHADLSDRDRWSNARQAIDALLELGAVPIVNENDTVAVEEIRFGDNDQLAAMVSTLVGADLLVLLTDVDGVLDQDEAVIPTVRGGDGLQHLFREAKDEVGRGGIASKVRSARRATQRGVPAVIGNAGDPAFLEKLLGGEPVGTLFLPAGVRLPSRKHWIAYALAPKGALLVDGGAVRALKGEASLLAAGIDGVRGDFEPGDCVTLHGPNGEEIGRGLTRFATADVARLAGAHSDEVETRLGRRASGIVMHRDDMVLV